MIMVSALIEKFQYAYDNGWGYIYGTAGVKWTQARQEALERKTSSNYDMSKKYGSKWIGHYVADCSGLFAWAFKQLGGSIAHGSNSIWRGYCTEKGVINGNLQPGTAVFKCKDSNNYYHIGLYIGGTTVIEAKGTVAGVVTSRLSEWTHYGILKDVDYTDTAPPETPEVQPGAAIVDVPNDGTVRVRTKPTTSGTVVTTLREGTQVTIESIEGSWAKVSFVQEGYIMKKFLKESD